MDAITTVTVNIDGREVQTHPGSMIIQAADAAGIYIPRFCYHEKLSIAANCRMCLVEVEKAPKPLPACATPVSEGMIVRTRSPVAAKAQQGTMEFLLINHPLDCPVCDQGGECPLQDQAVRYGQDYSRYLEGKRVIGPLDLGPLVATAMTRCIHCTRCVRFGREVAGSVELGATGRGEQMTIGTFLGGTIDSEVSGNIIDLCPVGALTSKPYRFSARSWELTSHDAVSPHDSLGSNLKLQTVHGSIKRVVPRDNEAVNECWISDRDRFAYEGADCDDRLTQPLVRTANGMEEVSWEHALEQAAKTLKAAGDLSEAKIGALIHPISSTEECFLLQKLVRALGSGNIDHRLFQRDFSDDPFMPAYAGIETPVADLEMLKGGLLIDCNPRKELPLVALRLRRMVLAGGRIGALGSLAPELNFPLAAQESVRPAELLATLCGVISTIEGGTAKLPEALRSRIREANDAVDCAALASILTDSQGQGAVILGQGALNHPDASGLRAAASILAELTASQCGWIAPGNSAGAWWAGAVPHRLPGGKAARNPGENAWSLTEQELHTLVLFGVEAAVDHSDPIRLGGLLDRAHKVVVLSSYRSAVPDQADIVLPITPYTESSGTFINCNGQRQFSHGALEPRGNARPGWKVLRVLGNFLGLDGFDYRQISEVGLELPEPPRPWARTDAQQWKGESGSDWPTGNGDLIRVGDIPIYRTDPVVRRAPALAQTHDGVRATYCRLHPQEMTSRGLTDGASVRVLSDADSIIMPVWSDASVLPGCVFLASADAVTAVLRTAQRLSIETVN